MIKELTSQTGKLNIDDLYFDVQLLLFKTALKFNHLIEFDIIRGGEEPNDYNGMPEECTFVIPNTPGRNGPTYTHGPMWGDISCEAESFDWPKSNSRVVMVPICEGKCLYIELLSSKCIYISGN